MTHPQYPTKTRAQIAAHISDYLLADGDNVQQLRATIAYSSTALHLHRYNEDLQWLRMHRRQTDDESSGALRTLAERLIQRLSVEGESIADDSRRGVDSLITDTAHHLANAGDRVAILAHMLTLGADRLAHLATDALVMLSDRARLVDENFQLRAQVNAAEARAEMAAAGAVQA